MYCSHCGKELEDGALFCPSCGAPVEANQPLLSYAGEAVAVEQKEQPVWNVGVEAASVPKKADNKWPMVTGFMGICYLFFVVLQFSCIFVYCRLENVPFTGLETWYLQIILVSLIPVLYFVHTKKLAILTAIPMFALTVIDVIGILANQSIWEYPEYVASVVLPTAASVVLLILYVIQMIVRPHSPVLSIVFLILSIVDLFYVAVLLIGSFTGLITGILRVDPANLFASVFGFVGLIFGTIAYSIAMFRSRRAA